MTTNELIKQIKEEGLESLGLYYACYKGFVYDNQDPEGLCRLRVSVPAIYGTNVPDTWAWSKGVPSGTERGLVLLPQKGDNIWVSFENGDPNYPIWEYGCFGTGDKPEKGTPTNMTLQFGSHRIDFNADSKELTITSAEGSSMTLDKNGVLKADKITLDAPSVVLSEATETALLGDTTFAKLTDLANILISATAPSFGTPLSSAPLIAQWLVDLNTIKSNKVKLA